MKIISLIFLISFTFATNVLNLITNFGGRGIKEGQISDEIYVAFDSASNIYISDTKNLRVQKFNSQGKFITTIPKDIEFSFCSPKKLTIDNKGNLYVMDWKNEYIVETSNPKLYEYLPCIHIFDKEGNFIKTFTIGEATKKRAAPADATVIVDKEGEYALAIKSTGYNRFFSIAVDSLQNIYIVDKDNNKVIKYTQDGKKLLEFGLYGSDKGEFDKPIDIVIDKNDKIFIADYNNHRIVNFNSNGVFLQEFGKKGRNDSEFYHPYYIAITKNNMLIVKDESDFQKKFLDHPFKEIDEQRAKEDEDNNKNQIFQRMFMDFEKEDFYTLQKRVEKLEDQLKEVTDEEKKDKEDKQEKFPKRYTFLLERIQIFNSQCQFFKKIIYKIDKNDEELNDLEFLCIDNLGNLYLLDKSDLIIKKYQIKGGFNFKNANLGYMTRRIDEKIEDSLDDPDLDKNVDISDTTVNFSQLHSLNLNYPFTEKSNVLFKTNYLTGKTKLERIYEPRIEDNFVSSNLDNDILFNLNFKHILNPNYYKYKEVNFYCSSSYGKSDYLAKSSDEKTIYVGDSKILSLGMDWDCTKNMNLKIEYYNLKPENLRRNYNIERERYNYPFTSSKLFNQRTFIVSEFRVKF